MALDAVGAAGDDEDVLGLRVAEAGDDLPQGLAVRPGAGLLQAVQMAAAGGDSSQPRLARGIVAGREAGAGIREGVHRGTNARAALFARP